MPCTPNLDAARCPRGNASISAFGVGLIRVVDVLVVITGAAAV